MTRHFSSSLISLIPLTPTAPGMNHRRMQSIDDSRIQTITQGRVNKVETQCISRVNYQSWKLVQNNYR